MHRLMMLRNRWIPFFAATIITLMMGTRAFTQDHAPTIAPIFLHGDGSGMGGTIHGYMVEILPEQEGRRVIAEEAHRAGLNFLPDALTLDSLDLPVVTNYPNQIDKRPDGKGPFHAIERRSLTLDGLDTTRAIGYVFISSDDYHAWNTRDSGIVVYDGGSQCDVLGTAEKVRQALLARPPRPTLAVFYSPVVGVKYVVDDERNGQHKRHDAFRDRKDAKQIALRELRLQVQDYITWLKTNGKLTP